jgi:hypothetical protein
MRVLCGEKLNMSAGYKVILRVLLHYIIGLECRRTFTKTAIRVALKLAHIRVTRYRHTNRLDFVHL